MKDFMRAMIVTMVTILVVGAVYALNTPENITYTIIGKDCGFLDERVTVIKGSEVFNEVTIIRSNKYMLDVDPRVLFDCK